MSIIELALQFLACPNCYGAVHLLHDKLTCQSCKAEFKILNENTIELVAQESFQFKTTETSEAYSEYSDLRNLSHPTSTKMRLWGWETKYGVSGFVTKLRNAIISMMQDEIICDVGAGVGNYSLYFAKKAKLVLHCDLDLETINIANQEAKKQNLKNILFIRCDYLYLPFRSNSLPCITSIDILEKGREHDAKLIEQISNKAVPGGLVIVDFHSKERTKLTRAPKTDRYSKHEITDLLNNYNLQVIKMKGMGYLPTVRNLSVQVYAIGDLICKLFFPPARWLVAARKIS